jgi:6-phosphofructokinase 2
MNKILTVTMNPAIDVSSTIEHVIADKKMRCRDGRYEPGGGGINVSRAIKRLGGESTAMYCAGAFYGEMLTRLLEAEKVAVEPVMIEGLGRESFAVTETSTNRQFRFTLPGPALSENEWMHVLDTILSHVGHEDYVVASGRLPAGVPQSFYARLGVAIAQREAQFILDTSGKALQQTMNTPIFLLKPNMRELNEIAPQPIRDEHDQEDAAMEMVSKRQCSVVLLSLGAAGALVATNDRVRRFRAPSVPINSRVGAGDSMVGGTVLALSRGEPLENAVLYGIAAGAAAVKTPGSELCRRGDTESLYEQLKRNPGK